jgi:hypothetical protein
MTLHGARKRLAASKDGSDKSIEVATRLKRIRQELLGLKQALESIEAQQPDTNNNIIQ